MCPERGAAIELVVDGHDVRISNPTGSTSRLAARRSSISPTTTSPSARGSCARSPSPLHAASVSAGVDGEKVHQKRLPAGARRGSTPSGSTSRPRRHADEPCVMNLAERCLGGADVDGRVPSVEHAAGRRSSSRTSGGSISTRCRSCPFETVRRAAHTRAGGPRRAGRGRLAEDLGWQRAARVRADRAAMGIRGRAARGARVRDRGRAADPRAVSRPSWWRRERDPRKVFIDYNQNARTTRSRAPTRFAASRPARSPRRSPGGRSTTSSPRSHDRDRSGALHGAR